MEWKNWYSMLVENFRIPHLPGMFNPILALALGSNGILGQGSPLSAKRARENDWLMGALLGLLSTPPLILTMEDSVPLYWMINVGICRQLLSSMPSHPL